MKKRYDVATILKRAADLGIDVTIEGNNLKVQARQGAITGQARAIFEEYKQDILHYLRSQEPWPLCSVCLMTNNKTVGCFDREGRLYCEQHYPARKRDRQAEILAHPVVSEIIRVFNVRKVEILDSSAASCTSARSREELA